VEAAADAGIERDQACDNVCINMIRLATVRRLNRSLERVLLDLERARVQKIVVDVTDNGGGSDWAEVIARMLAGPLRSSRIAMLKHPAWEAYLDSLLPDIQARTRSATPDRRIRLERTLRLLREARHSLGQPCDLAAAWTDRDLAMGTKALPCTTLVVTEFYQTGVESGLPPPIYAPDDAALFRLAPFGPPPQRVTRRPIIVLVNDGTHSAAEMFAAVLQDNRRATVIGAPTAGAACGTFTRRGTHFTLPASGARVRVPDCVRLRADGSNERRGIMPDRIVPWAPSDSAYQRAQKALETILATLR
jgi:Peptidase family S41